MTINKDVQIGRAKNATLAFFEHKLYIPKIYLDADWNGHRLDVLAIDRDGSGEIHAVLLFAYRYFPSGGLDDGYEWEAERELLDRFSNIEANFKYIGVVDTGGFQKVSRFNLVDSISDKSFSNDGVGRVGFLKIDVLDAEEPHVQMEIKPERFRAKIAKLADEFVQGHEADWEIRA